jgi:hypothetical protein
MATATLLCTAETRDFKHLPYYETILLRGMHNESAVRRISVQVDGHVSSFTWKINASSTLLQKLVLCPELEQFSLYVNRQFMQRL